MSEYGFSLTRFCLYKYKIEDSVLIRENTSQRKSIFLHILRSFLHIFCIFFGIFFVYFLVFLNMCFSRDITSRILEDFGPVTCLENPRQGIPLFRGKS